MKWLLFWISLAIVFLLANAVLSRWAPAYIDLFLMLTLVVALIAPVHDARLAGWLVGFAQDIGTTGPIGPFAFSLGLTAWIATMMRESFNLKLWWVRFLVAFTAGATGQLILRGFQHYALDMFATTRDWMGSAFSAAAVAGLVAATVTATVAFRRRGRRGMRRARA
ncbi:MAG: rod shape-determining protein MreD [Phycisphaerae bacterium]